MKISEILKRKKERQLEIQALAEKELAKKMKSVKTGKVIQKD